MKPAVFVSHASQDKEAVAKLCADLQERGVDTWASFKDIPPGAVWNKAIAEALEAATHVIVVVSQASITSDYVGAEVEWALANEKKVIPVLVIPIKMPLRWYTLQYVDLTSPENREAAWQSLVNQLPKNTQSRFRALLEGEPSTQQIREFLWVYPQVIKPSAVTQKQLRKLVLKEPLSNEENESRTLRLLKLGLEGSEAPDFAEARVLAEMLSRVDFFSVRAGTVSRCEFTYLLSAASPFDPAGTRSAELETCLEDAKRVLSAPDFMLVLQTALAYSLGIPNNEMSAGVTLVAGRRQHYRGAVLAQRLVLEQNWAAEKNAEIPGRLDTPSEALGETGLARFVRIDVEMMSYDHLLERI